MIKDVKSYIHTVGNRLSKAFSIEAFGTEDQLEFWELSAEHFSRKDIPAFSEIVGWINLLYRAPVQFVYRYRNEKLILDRRHVITENILKQSGSNKSRAENSQEREYIRNFEHQLQNLEKKMDMDEVFLEHGITSHAIGPCEHIPLFDKESNFWGIYCVGPYTKSPAQITPKLSIVGRILSEWLIGLEVQESNPQKDYREKVEAIISDLGSGHLNTRGIAQVLLRYIAHQQKVDVGMVVDLITADQNVLSSIGVPDKVLEEYSKTGKEKWIESHNNTLQLSDHGKNLAERLNIDLELIPFGQDPIQGALILEKAENTKLNVHNLAASFSDLLLYREENRSFSEQLMNTYYEMIRILEQSREKTKFHTPRIVAFVQRFGMFFGLEDEEMEIITQTAKLHDIGYVGAISVEPNRTIGGEIDHPVIGAELIKHLAVPEDVVEGIRTHHEWVNGNGSPNGLRSDQIPWTGKIIALFEYVVDFIETNQGDASKTEEEWIELLSKGLMQRADVEYDMVLIPTAIQLIQALGWDECIRLGTQN